MSLLISVKDKRKAEAGQGICINLTYKGIEIPTHQK
jgi:hypothetical protein